MRLEAKKMNETFTERYTDRDLPHLTEAPLDRDHLVRDHMVRDPLDRETLLDEDPRKETTGQRQRPP